MPEGIGYTSAQVITPPTSQPTPPVEKKESLETLREETLRVEEVKNEQRIEATENDQPVEVEPTPTTSAETLGAQIDVFI